MSKYGLKIKNIEASTLLENNIGIRDHFEYTNAMLTNSLLFDFLKDNGLKTWKETFTRDIICLEFNYGTRSYEEQYDHLNKLLDKYQDNEEKKIKLQQLLIEAENNKDKYVKLSKERIREKFYEEGCDVTYITRKKNGDITKTETIHYVMLFRSTGKAKKGSCMFIKESLYKKTINFLRMGIKLPKHNAPIIEISAYAPLVASTIVDKIHISPKNILVIHDIDSYFRTNVISIETDKNKHCIAKPIENYQVANTMFDGQALIDSSIFPQWGNGYILLRHHFCKMAAFNTNIQQFYMDYYGKDYDTAKVTDMFGKEHYVKDIKLITTDQAMKWLKLNVSYDYWCNKVNENGAMFGIVKTAHESKLGEVQRMSYQMINALDIDIMPNVVKTTQDYVYLLKSNDDAFLDFLSKNENFSNDYKVLIALVEQDREFLRSEYFRRRKEYILRSYVDNLRRGHIIQNGDNLVIVGSPYAMLISSVEQDISCDTTFKQEKDCIQCYTERFSDDTHLACFRSPFNSKNNMGYLHNVYSSQMQRYFVLGKQAIAVNMINTDFQDRNNGLI